ncbi:class I SAM-dependent methyltransferase [Virgibacillus sp. W0430]|uniref:class I SAM-dependent methyltransferase n=1 Tax=Virgibacillus sp. W0430 TaxID=3391580 RepID=UPI003F44B542
MGNGSNWQETVEREWDGRAHFWNARSQQMWDKGSRKEIIPFIKKYIAAGKKILDVGCGDGYGSFKLKQAGYTVMGVDISAEMIAYARENQQNNNIGFFQSDAAELPFSDKHFDALVAINVLEWTEQPKKVLEELQRVVKTNGVLCIGILGPTAGPRANSFPRLYGKRVVCNTMMPWEFEQMALENGWTSVDCFGVYKEGVKEKHYADLSIELQQALSFMWVFMLRKAECN